jgi:hypothetical protein
MEISLKLVDEKMNRYLDYEYWHRYSFLRLYYAICII